MLGNIFRKQPGNPKVPAGQSVTERFPIMTYGPTPRVTQEQFELRVFGLAEEKTFSWDDLLALPQTDMTKDFHCVTHWSKMDVSWTGVLSTELMKHVTPDPAATHILFHCYGGYTTNLSIEDFLAPNCLLAHKLEGQPIPTEHGGPVRTVIPHLYAWKSAK